jgi:hypothetical protein
MHLLYADESGCISDPSQRYFVLAGISAFEREPHWIEQELEKIAARFDPCQPHSIELHGSPMRTGRSGWDRYPKADREQAMLDALKCGICDRHAQYVRLFGAVLEKRNFSGQDIAKIAFEQLSSRFDHFLGRLHNKNRDTQRGLILFDNHPPSNEFKHLLGSSNTPDIRLG